MDTAVICSLLWTLTTVSWVFSTPNNSSSLTVSVDCSGRSGNINVIVRLCEAEASSNRLVPTSEGYAFIPGLGFYKMHPHGATWQRAQAKCKEEGTHLIVINSQREAEVVVELFAVNPTFIGAEQTVWAWTQLKESGCNGNYVTLDGQPLSTTGFDLWSPTEPNDAGQDDCVLTNRINAKLADAACTRLFAFICELEV